MLLSAAPRFIPCYAVTSDGAERRVINVDGRERSSAISASPEPLRVRSVLSSGNGSQSGSSVASASSAPMDVEQWTPHTPISCLFDELSRRACIDRAKLREVERRWEEDEWASTVGSVAAASWYVFVVADVSTTAGWSSSLLLLAGTIGSKRA